MRRFFVKTTTIICLGAAVLVTGFTVTWAMKAVPKKPGKVYGPSAGSSQKSQVAQGEYDRLLALYISNAKDIKANVEKDEQRRLAEDRADWNKSSQKDSEIQGKQSELIGELTAESKRTNRKLGGEMSRRVYEVLSPTSDSSAQVFETLLQQDIVDKADILACLEPRSHLLTSKWISLVRDIADGKADAAKGKYSAHIRAARILYSLGIDQGKYRPMPEQQVKDYNDDNTLNALFFRKQKSNGTLVAVKSPENQALLNEMSESRKAPMLRFACANYAAEIGDMTKAESICVELLSARYKWFDNRSGSPSEEDRRLGAARELAMRLLFRRVCSEQAFRIVYDLSQNPKVEIQDEYFGWIRLSSYVRGQIDVDLARSLIKEIRDYDKAIN